MAWQPIVTDAAARERICGILRDIAGAVAARETAPDDPDEPADHALMRTYLASDDVVPDDEGVAGAALAAAVERVRRVQRPALFGGVTRIGWTIAHLADPDTAEAGCTSVDQALARVLEEWTGDYDLIAGVVGFGVYALERGPSGAALADAVVRWLEAKAVERHGGVAWFTGPELLVEHQREVAPDGYWNFGLAHGVPGVIGLLARCVANGVSAERALALLERAVVHLLAAEPGGNEDGRFRAWQPSEPAERSDALRTMIPAASVGRPVLGASPTEPASKRLAWCYGDLGVAATLLGAGLLVDRPAWRDEGLALARACARRTRADAAIQDAALCHGAFGISHLFNRMAQGTGDGELAAAAVRWFDAGLAMRNDEPLAGWPAMWIEKGTPMLRADATLLSGAPGVALALHAAISEIEPSWDRLLLVDVPPR